MLAWTAALAVPAPDQGHGPLRRRTRGRSLPFTAAFTVGYAVVGVVLLVLG